METTVGALEYEDVNLLRVDAVRHVDIVWVLFRLQYLVDIDGVKRDWQ